jgi:hypothetical protein
MNRIIAERIIVFLNNAKSVEEISSVLMSYEQGNVLSQDDAKSLLEVRNKLPNKSFTTLDEIGLKPDMLEQLGKAFEGSPKLGFAVGMHARSLRNLSFANRRLANSYNKLAFAMKDHLNASLALNIKQDPIVAVAKGLHAKSANKLSFAMDLQSQSLHKMNEAIELHMNAIERLSTKLDK